MNGDEFAEYLPRMLDEYVAERTRHGDDPAEARSRGVNDTAKVREQGPGGPEHGIFVLNDEDGVAVGELWLGTQDAWTSAWIYDIRIEPAHRGRGLGRAALTACELRARELGATSIGLHVFGDNEVARGLYRTSGYVEQHVSMSKSLG
jgi:ribosomal protein S18 acetylase RimI-like enzyme